MSERRTTRHRVIAVRPLANHAFLLRLERDELAFRAGQCVNVGLPGVAVNREYSTYSAESDPHLDFLIKEVADGIVSPALRNRRPDELVEVHGAYGEFCLHTPDDGRKYLFIGTGTGIAPFHSFVATYPALDYTIVHGTRYAEESYGSEDYEVSRYVSCVSRGPGGNFHGRVTDYIRANPPDPEAVCYLCGNRAMINEMYGLLREQGVSSDNLLVEVFF